MSWQCGTVSTKMLKVRAGGLIVTVDAAVKGMLRDLSYESLTYGLWKHSLLALAANSINLELIKMANYRFSKFAHIKQLAKGIADKK